MTWFERLEGMTGRMALTRESEAECLAHYTSIPGDHIEVGCLWGGTAILTALAKQDAGSPGQVYTIDPMVGGWWDTEDPDVHLRPTPKIVKNNLKLFKLSRRVYVIQAKSSPWPVPAEVKPATMFIDGNHAFEYVSEDWKKAATITGRYILLHDYNSKNHPGVQRAVDEIARSNRNWKFAELVNSIAVFERVK